ncbi:sodium:proton antiporter [Kribbella jiaozuonensis]|uniref:Sodium:proton antiporter n=1 Tax=Kribbella jiaozuonensis TaxID=2575441 RepID=A0A4U3LKF8_9ACTN|nr:sodium:proton antiporter [Kribbella jiaozuonensis]
MLPRTRCHGAGSPIHDGGGAVTEATFAVLALLVLAWAVTSDLLARANITGPLVFTAAGFVLGNPDWGPLKVHVEAPSVHLLAELTLAMLLFSDASRVNLSGLKRDINLPVRLLGIGLPLSVIIGSLLAAWLFDDFTWALAGFVGATLAPTDAALSAQVVNDQRIPMRLRRALNVESGLNDGIVTPIVTFTLAVAAGQLGTAQEGDASTDGSGALLELAIGLGVGVVVGLGSGRLLTYGSRRDWVSTGAGRLGTFAGALSSFALAVALSGNGFIAAFVAGIAFRAGLDEDVIDADNVIELPELVGEILAFAVWFLFGAALVPFFVHNFDVPLLAYAVLSLTAVRMVPVALALLGKGLDSQTVLFVGWFGPRGLASVVFALLAIEELGENEVVERAVAAVALTVLLSVVLHGISAGPLGRRYVRLEQAEDSPGPGPRSRRSPHHHLNSDLR